MHGIGRRAAVLLTLALSIAGCGTLPEAKETGDLVVRYSERLNRELSATETSLSGARADRAERARADALAAEQRERAIAAQRREWAVAEDKTAERLFDSVRKGRPQPIDIALAIPAADAIDPAKAKPKLYDPVPLETVIKRIKDLTKDDSLQDRTRFALGFGKRVWSEIEKKQQEANAQAQKAEANAQAQKK